MKDTSINVGYVTFDLLLARFFFEKHHREETQSVVVN